MLLYVPVFIAFNCRVYLFQLIAGTDIHPESTGEHVCGLLSLFHAFTNCC
ncbi:hypothetical protein Sjap_018126 [Stephania japonica]|uniref:Uncharacterized protein n=1 Tax=Stephania japonica TaxID=461633 RepID=A0AAP0NMT9_9MAGN